MILYGHLKSNNVTTDLDFSIVLNDFIVKAHNKKAIILFHY